MDEHQGELFPLGDSVPMLPTSGLFAELVFDRPLDHVYTYATPQSLAGQVAVGKRIMAPFGRGDKATVGFCVGLNETPPDRAVKQLYHVLDDEPLLSPELLRLTRWMADYYMCGWGQVLNGVVPAGAKQNAGTRTANFVEVVAAELCPNPLPLLTAKQKLALEHVRAAGHALEVGELAEAVKCGAAPIRKLIDKGLLRRFQRRVENVQPLNESERESRAPLPISEPLVLNEDQQLAWSSLEPKIQDEGFHAFLLYGVTGSGKTELYLRAIEEVIKQGKEALVLVPEISLTPQTIARFRGRCGNVAVLHSNLQNAERGGHWRRIAGGLAQVVVGARSAVFAPTRRLGLIVIDEEHENSFKEEKTPRYHARDVAVMRASLENIPIILGSATPSLESWYNAQRGQYTLLQLPKRVLDRPLPQVSLIDMRHDVDPRRRFQGISPGLEEAMHTALADGGQVMLLLNRRGFSTFIHCPSCGYVEQCKFCDLSLTFHKERNILMCHYCGYERPPGENCPKCSQTQVRFQGMGTEKLLAEVERKFPNYVVRRMDSDSMRRPGSHQQVLDEFRDGVIHILLGTQMIAKGLDFPNVTLVGVVNADIGLHHADFRAGERTFQLLAQVSGRTGRGPRGGKVLVQTFSPEHPSIILAAAHEFEPFAKIELAQRHTHNYPPYQRMARILVRSKEQAAACEHSDRLAGAFGAALGRIRQPDAVVRLLGPAEASVFRLKGLYRYHFQLQSSSSGLLHQVLRHTLPAVRTPKGVELTVDVDPYDML